MTDFQLTMGIIFSCKNVCMQIWKLFDEMNKHFQALFIRILRSMFLIIIFLFARNTEQEL